MLVTIKQINDNLFLNLRINGKLHECLNEMGIIRDDRESATRRKIHASSAFRLSMQNTGQSYEVLKHKLFCGVYYIT